MAESFMNVLRFLAAYLLEVIPSNKPHGRRLFDAISLHSWNEAFEGVVFRRSASGEIEVYMARRGPNETWPGQWHVPGTVLWSKDNGPQDQVARLVKKELQVPVTAYKAVDIWYNVTEGRGKCKHVIYLLTLDGEPPAKEGSGWFPVGNLPPDTIHYHRDEIIPRALNAYDK